MRTPLSLCALAVVGFVVGACSASTSGAEPTSDSDSEDLTAAKDAVLIKNPEAFWNKAIYDDGGGDKYQITYDQLGSKLGDMVKENNPDPKEEWAARAYRAKVTNGAGQLTYTVLIIDGIDDEGETDTIYTTRGTELASGGTYRSEYPAWATTTTTK